MKGMGKMKKSIIFSLAILSSIIILLFTGCGKDADISGSLITINKDGSIEARIVESFDKDYYNVDELVAMTNQELAAYNGSITLESYELSGTDMSMTFSFSNVDAFNSYMPEKLFVGNIQNAYAAGYSINRSLNNVATEGAVIGKENLQNMASSKVIVIQGSSTVRCPSDVSYYEVGTTLVDHRTVKPDANGVYFIMYK